MASENKNKRSYVEFLSDNFERLGAWSYDHRWIVLLLIMLFVGICGYFASGVRFDNSFEAFFDRNDPTYVDFLQYREDFGSDEVSYILYNAPDFEHGPWNMDVMRKIDKLTKAIEDEVPFVKEATSPANVEFIEGKEGSLIVYDLLSDFPKSQEELIKLRDKVLKKPIYVGGLISKDAKYAAIMIEMEKSSVDPPEEIRLDPAKGNALDNLYPQVTFNKIEEILARPEYKGITFYHSGDVPLNAEYNVITQNESAMLGALSFIIIGLLLIFFFRHFAGAAGPLCVVLFSIIITVGFIGILGWDFDLMFTMLPTLLIVVGVADSVHIVTEFRFYQRRLGDRKEAVKRTIYLVGVPCLFTSLTTVAGFISMSISPIKAIEHFAVYSAIGVAFAFMLTVTILLVFLSMGREKRSKKTQPDSDRQSRGSGLMYKILIGISHLDIRFKKTIIVIFGVIFVFSAMGLARLRVDSNWLNEFSEEVEVRNTTEIVDKVMGGTGGFSFIFDTKKEDGILDPAVLREIDSLQQQANKETDVVMKTYSIVDLLKDINQTFNNEDPRFYKIPDTKELVAQYLLVYEMSGGDELSSYISSDYARANLEVRCKMVNTSELKRVMDNLELYLKSTSKLEYIPQGTGMGALWIVLVDYIVESQIKGFLLAFTVIAIMMCFLFKSFRIGLLSMIPNLSPVFITLGAMGWLDIPLDYVKLLIGVIAICIAVDDTIHLVTRFHHEFKRSGNYEEALKNSMKDVGRAILITTILLVSGFIVFRVSVMESLSFFGSLIAMTLVVAMIADFFLMPALVLALKPFGPEGKAAAADAVDH